MQIVAQSWLVFRLTDSAFMLGLVNFVGLLPVVPVSLFSGVISDRFSRRVIIIIADIILSIQAFILAALTYMGVVEVWHVILLSFVLGTAIAFEGPARFAFVVDTVGKDDLTNAVALNSSVLSTARIIGPTIAGISVAWIGESGVFFLNGITYLVVIVALVAIRVSYQPQIEHQLDQNITGSLISGFNYVWKNNSIRALMTIVAVSSFFTMGYVALSTIFADDVLNAGSEGLGYLMTAVGIGAMLGAFVVANIHEGQRGKWMTVGNTLGPAILIVFTLSRSLTLSLILIACVAFNSAIRQTLANSLIQINTPVEFQGRVMSIFNLLFNGMSRVGVMAIGGLAELLGIALAVAVGAVISLLWGLFVIWRMPYIYRLA
jgi:predicted MFS family arabinose efflux permease